MSISKGTRWGFPSLVLAGDIDRVVAPSLRKALRDQVAKRAGAVVLECTHVTFADASFVSAVLDTIGELPPGGWIAILNMPRNPLRVLSVAGLLQVEAIKVFSTVEEFDSKIAGERNTNNCNHTGGERE